MEPLHRTYDLFSFLEEWPNIQTLTVMTKRCFDVKIFDPAERPFVGTVYMYFQALMKGNLYHLGDCTSVYNYSGEGVWSSKSPFLRLSMAMETIYAIEELLHADSVAISLVKKKKCNLIADSILGAIRFLDISGGANLRRYLELGDVPRVIYICIRQVIKKVLKSIWS